MALELADIFRRYGPAYRQKYATKLLPSHRKTMRAIECCRTEALGGQVYHCTACGETRYSYHSCRNRHCPKCQHEQTEEWLEVQRELLLPVPYFLLTFTLPAQLRLLASQNQKCIYNLLFRASAQATQQLAQDLHFVGGQVGMVGVLHTWTRKLAYHPHVHYLVPGGGWHTDGQTWLKAHHNFFVPVKALSRLFRATFQRLLRKTPLFAQIPPNVWQQDWVVHCKPVGNGQMALRYLAPYIYRVALSNRRLVRIENTGQMESSQVTFQYRTSDSGQLKQCTLSVEKFMHRFLQHVLPRGFVKVRYYGFFGAALRPRLITIQQHLGKFTLLPHADHLHPQTSPTPAQSNLLCPQCGLPMLLQRTLAPTLCRSP
ncbi:MAG TPA: IS91 family transposase [Anaerolineales bacterium]|nr:IS91 family transposase [Anaerolineales bacterium]